MVYVKKSYDKKIDGKEIYKDAELQFGENAFDSIEDAIEAGDSEIAVLDSKTEIKTDITDDTRITTNYNNEKSEDNYEGKTLVSKSTLTVKGGVDASGVYAEAFANVTVGKDAKLAAAWGGTYKENNSWNDDYTVTSGNGNRNVGGTFTAEKGAEIIGIMNDDNETVAIEGFSKVTLTDVEVSGEIVGGTGSYSSSINSSTSASGDVTKTSTKNDNKGAVSGSVTISVTKDLLEDDADVDFAAAAGIFGYSKVVISGTEGKEYDAYAVVGDIKAMETVYGFAGSFSSTMSTSSVEKVDSSTKNEKESAKAAAAGSVKLAVAKAGEIVGYKNVILTEDSEAVSIDAGLNGSRTLTYDYSDKNDKVASTRRIVGKSSSVGTVTVDGAFVYDFIEGYAKVIIEDGAIVGKISNESDFVNETVTTDEGTAKEKIVNTRTEKAAGSVTVKANKNYDDDDTVAGDIFGYANVNVSGYNAKGDILFVTVGNIASSNTKTVSTTEDGDTEIKTTIDTVGKVTVTNACAENIDAKTVVLEKALVGAIGTPLYNDDDLTQNLKGNSLTMKSATVTGILNVETVTVAKGVNVLDGFYSNNSKVADKFTIAAGASLILTENAAILADKKDKVTVNGSLIVNSADNIADIDCDILGKGEIAASDAVLADIKDLDLDIAKSIKFVNTGDTSVGFVGSKFEAADNTAKAAVNWDFDFTGDFIGWLNGGADADVVDKVDYIKFYVDVDEDNDEVKVLEIDGLADDDKVIVNGKTYTFEDFSAEDFEIKKDGLYTVGIELGKTNSDKDADSISYTIALA